VVRTREEWSIVMRVDSAHKSQQAKLLIALHEAIA